MILHFSNWKRLFQNTWLEDAQIEAEHHQMTKQVPKSSDVNIARKKEFIKKIMVNAQNVEFLCLIYEKKWLKQHQFYEKDIISLDFDNIFILSLDF